jgi:GntR family transcriptional regulator of vanillate catabolism
VARGERISSFRWLRLDVADANPARARAARPRRDCSRRTRPADLAVREFTLAEVRDTIELRGVLEGTAARLAAERLTASSELDVARWFCRQMDELERLTVDSFADYMDANEAFHSAILDLAKSEMLRRTLELTNSLQFASPSAMVFPTSVLPKSDETLAIAQEHHRAILKRSDAAGHAREVSHASTLLARRVLDLPADRDALSRVPGGSLISLATN